MHIKYPKKVHNTHNQVNSFKQLLRIKNKRTELYSFILLTSVYFDQRISAADSKCLLINAFFIFLHEKRKKEEKEEKIRQTFVFWAGTQMLIEGFCHPLVTSYRAFVPYSYEKTKIFSFFMGVKLLKCNIFLLVVVKPFI